ncbi:hypothetical protein AAZX31_19G216000 [Glycine max]
MRCLRWLLMFVALPSVANKLLSTFLQYPFQMWALNRPQEWLQTLQSQKIQLVGRKKTLLGLICVCDLWLLHSFFIFGPDIRPTLMWIARL